MHRLLFEKTGNAVWISHLDLMRLFQRAFKRAGLFLTHTQGFNPRPSVSIALPLSVGLESVCELLDFTLDGESVPCEEICKRLNETLVPGVRVREVYNTGRKLKELAFLDCSVTLEYDNGIPTDAQDQLQALFSAESLIVPKKGKNGIQDQDIIPLIKKLEMRAGEKELVCTEPAAPVHVHGDTCVEITQVDSAMNLTVVFQMIGVGLLLTLVASAASVLFIMRYDPLKILANRD